MTDPIANAAADLESLKALKALELRLRLPKTLQCQFCGAILPDDAYACDRDGWIVGEKFKSA